MSSRLLAVLVESLHVAPAEAETFWTAVMTNGEGIAGKLRAALIVGHPPRSSANYLSRLVTLGWNQRHSTTSRKSLDAQDGPDRVGHETITITPTAWPAWATIRPEGIREKLLGLCTSCGVPAHHRRPHHDETLLRSLCRSQGPAVQREHLQNQRRTESSATSRVPSHNTKRTRTTLLKMLQSRRRSTRQCNRRRAIASHRPGLGSHTSQATRRTPTYGRTTAPREPERPRNSGRHRRVGEHRPRRHLRGPEEAEPHQSDPGRTAPADTRTVTILAATLQRRMDHRGDRTGG